MNDVGAIDGASETNAMQLVTSKNGIQSKAQSVLLT